VEEVAEMTKMRYVIVRIDVLSIVNGWKGD